MTYGEIKLGVSENVVPGGIVVLRRRDDAYEFSIPGFFTWPCAAEPEYTDGLYAIAGEVKFVDYLAEKQGQRHVCSNLMEWAYNNPYQNNTEYSEKKGVRLPYLDGSGANAVSVVGSMKEIWKEFEHSPAFSAQFRSFCAISAVPLELIEREFWEYYIGKYSDKFERGVKKLERYVAERRAGMTESEKELERKKAGIFAEEETWIRGCRDFLKHLIYTTPKGYILELVLLNVLSGLTDSRYEESDLASERAGTDGYLIFPEGRMPVSLKPASYRKWMISPVNSVCFVTYERKWQHPEDIVFTAYSGGRFLAVRAYRNNKP